MSEVRCQRLGPFEWPVWWLADLGRRFPPTPPEVVVLVVIALPLIVLLVGAALFLLSVLFFVGVLVMFPPLRLYHWLWLRWRGIYRRCPYDDCGRAGLPIHICSCGTRYADLLPSYHGLFYHTCAHDEDEMVPLPTMDFLGRKKLPRLCRHCERPLILSSFGELPERPVALVGGPGAGKTVFLRQAVRDLTRRLAALPDGRAEVDAVEHVDLDRDLGLLDRGLLPGKTAGDVMQALGLAVRLGRPRQSCLLYLYDAPGEDFMSLERLGRKQHLEHLAGVVLLLDPFSLPLLQARTRNLAGSAVAPDHVVGVLAGAATQLRHGTGGRCAVSVAVVLTKSDALPVEELPFLTALRHGPASAAVREALERLGGGNAARALEQRFDNVRYFACSALGRPPDAADTRPFRPEGVAEPLLWLLGVGTGYDPQEVRP